MRSSGRGRRVSHREILGLALPALATLAADPLLSVVDTALVGHLGPSPLAALALAVVAFNLLFIVFNFLAYGTTGPIARLLASGRSEEAVRYAVQAIWVALALGVTCTALGQLLARPAGALLGGDGEVLELFLAYFRIRLLALTPMLLVVVGHGVFRGLQDTRSPLAVTVVANLTNAGLSFVLVYPMGMGVQGAAAGTLVAQSLAAVAFLYLGVRRLRPLAGGRPWAVAAGPLRELLRLSRDLVMRTLSLHGVFVVSTAVAARMGTEVVAGHQVAVELWMFLAMVLDSLAIAGQALVGRSLGRGSPDEAREFARILVRWGLVLGAVLGGAYLALADLLPRIFTTDPEVLATAALVIPMVALFQPLNAYVFVLDGVLIGAGDVRYLALGMAASAATAVPIILLSLPLGWGVRGIWAGLAVLMLARAVVNGRRVRGGSWLGAAQEDRGREAVAGA